MQYSPALASPQFLHALQRPPLKSLDSGQECSLDHWLEVAWLVEHEEDELQGYVFDDSCLLLSR